MVAVAQLGLERQVVALEVAGSNPVSHPPLTGIDEESGRRGVAVEPCGPPAPPPQAVTPVRGRDARIFGVSLWAVPPALTIIGDNITGEMVFHLGGTAVPGTGVNGVPLRVWVSMRETNRFPGMQTLPGRIALHSLELSGIAWATSQHKRPWLRTVGKIAAVLSTGVHLRSTIINEHHRRQMVRGVRP
jgi:hypothetical protein